MKNSPASLDEARTTRRLQAAVIFLGCTLLYYLTRSPALDEWDSIQFAMGVGEFNLWKHQPHPPGYPLYIAFGWLGERLLGLDAHDALSLGSAIGGGLFVAGWWMLIARRFAWPVTVLSTVTIAGMVNTWMSATKVLTDPLGTGLLTLALVLFDHPVRDQNKGRSPLLSRAQFAAGGLTAAAAVGVRPQNFGILLLIVALAVLGKLKRQEIRRRSEAWLSGLGAFLVGCLLWVVPVLAIQARTPESGGSWWAYGGQLRAQWRWRLDQPKAFLGAAGQDRNMLLYRLDHHLLGWFTRGFGFSLDTVLGWAGLIVVLAGWMMYVLACRRQREGAVQREFWRAHLPWAGAYVLMIFCCLPGDQRYYLPIFPLYVVAAVAGWWTYLSKPWQWATVAVPVVALMATAPLVGPNHTDEPPPVRLVRWLQMRHSPAEQGDVWLILRDTWRHAEWYAPGFRIVRGDRFDPQNPPEGLERARTVYTDDPLLLAQWPVAAGTAASWRKVAEFQRSILIYRKHNTVELYRLDGVTPK